MPVRFLLSNALQQEAVDLPWQPGIDRRSLLTAPLKLQ
jgi:hypothetical protein